MERWITTRDTKEAAAFAALGATVRIHSSIMERTSERIVRFHVSTTTAGKLWLPGKIRKDVRDGTLRDPAHPYLVILRAYANRKSRIAILKDGARFRLVETPAAPGVFGLAPADTGLPGLAGVPAIVRTRDARLCDALLTAGFPLLQITGAGREHEFTHAAHQAAQRPGLDAARLLATWWENPANLPPDNPFTIAALGLHALDQLHREVSRAIDNILISKKGTTSHAVIRADATDAAWDKARQFFTGIR